jgi:hypothetical protein
LPQFPLCFDHRFLWYLLLEIGSARSGSIFRHPRQAQRRLEIEPMPYVPIYQRISLFHRASKIEPLHNVPIFSLKNAANFRRIHMSLPRLASNGRPHDAKRPPGTDHPSVCVARFLSHACHRSLQNAPPVITSKCTTSDGYFLLG